MFIEIPYSFRAAAATLPVVAAATLAVPGSGLGAQAPNNPYKPNYQWGSLPDGRQWGSVSAIYPSADGNIWVAERCGANTCVGSNVDPVLLMDPNGSVLRSFGAGMIAWPHGMHVDGEGNVWIADAWANGATTTGHTVLKFSPTGQLLMTIGTPGQAGNPPTHLNRPNDVVVAPNGDIFVVEGHGAGEPNRMHKYSKDGTFIRTIGETGYGPGQFHEPHAIAMDSQGRLFIADRYNNRIQIMDQEGRFISAWTQFGRPSGIFIDQHDLIYVADSESGPAANNITGQRNAGWERGLRIGDARTGWVFHFIPETWNSPNQGVNSFSGPEGVAVDRMGNVYGAEVSQRRVVKYTRLHPLLVPVRPPGGEDR